MTTSTATWHEGLTEQIVIPVTENGTNVSSLAGATAEYVLCYRDAVVLTLTTSDFTVSAPNFTYNLSTTDLAGSTDGVYDFEWKVTDSAGRRRGGTGTLTIVEMK